MSKQHGIVHTSRGSYRLATVESKADSWRVVSVSDLPANEQLRQLALLGKGVHFGIKTTWLSSSSQLAQNGSLCASTADPLTPCCRAAECDLHEDALAENLVSTFSRDVYLVAIPIAFGNISPGTFVSLHRSEGRVLAGVVIDGSLKIVVGLSADSSNAILGGIERLAFFWRSQYPQTPFPDRAVCVGERLDLDSGGLFGKIDVVPLPPECADHDTLAAVGVALSGELQGAPAIAGPSEASSQRRFRAWGYVAAAVLLVMSLLAFLAPFGVEAWYKSRRDAYVVEYREAIKKNKEIKRLLDESNELARSVLRLEETFSRRTHWAQLLEVLGTDAPNGLYIERFGSQNLTKDSEQIEVALSGWTANEPAVTAFIGKLQTLPYLSRVRLASMARAKQRKDISQFRILCRLTLEND